MLINIKTRHFHSSVYHQEHLFHITHITSYFRLVNIAKFLKTAFLEDTSRSSPLQMFFRIGVFRNLTIFKGNHLCWSLLLKNLQAEGLQLHKKRLQHSCFLAEFAKFLRTTFLKEHLWRVLLHFFFKKALLNSHFTKPCYNILIFFSSPHIV